MMCSATEEFVAAFDRAQRLVEIQCPTVPCSHHQAHGHEHTIAAATKLLLSLGFPEKIGGWQKLSNNSFLGTCRALLPWFDLSGSRRTGVGTNIKYYVEEGGAYFDITP